MSISFERISGETADLRALLAHIRANLPADAVACPPMDHRLLVAIGIEAEDVLDFTLPVVGGQATIQLLISPVRGLSINHVAASAGRDVLSEEERGLLVSRLLEECLMPAFKAHPGCALVLLDGDERKTIRHRSA